MRHDSCSRDDDVGGESIPSSATYSFGNNGEGLNIDSSVSEPSLPDLRRCTESQWSGDAHAKGSVTASLSQNLSVLSELLPEILTRMSVLQNKISATGHQAKELEHEVVS